MPAKAKRASKRAGKRSGGPAKKSPKGRNAKKATAKSLPATATAA